MLSLFDDATIRETFFTYSVKWGGKRVIRVEMAGDYSSREIYSSSWGMSCNRKLEAKNHSSQWMKPRIHSNLDIFINSRGQISRRKKFEVIQSIFKPKVWGEHILIPYYNSFNCSFLKRTNQKSEKAANIDLKYSHFWMRCVSRREQLLIIPTISEKKSIKSPI